MAAELTAAIAVKARSPDAYRGRASSGSRTGDRVHFLIRPRALPST